MIASAARRHLVSASALALVTTTAAVVMTAPTAMAATTVDIGRPAWDAVVSPDGSRLYLANGTANSLTVVDTSSDLVESVVPIGGTAYAVAAANTVHGERVFVGSVGQVAVVDPVTGSVVDSIETEQTAEHLVISPDGARLFVDESPSNRLLAYDTATFTLEGSAQNGGITGSIDVSPDGSRLYATYRARSSDPLVPSLKVVDADTMTIVETVAVPGHPYIGAYGIDPFGMAVAPDGARLYVADMEADAVHVLDTATWAVVGSVPVGSRPSGIALTPDSRRMYVANQASASVSVVDAATLEAETISATATPYTIAITPDGRGVYVVDAIAPLMTVLRAPDVVVVAPSDGSVTGGNTVTITGAHLAEATAVWFGDVEATSFTVQSASEITAVVPPAASPGPVDVVVTSADGTSRPVSYTYRVNVVLVGQQATSAALGEGVRDRVVLDGALDPTGVVTFRLYGPGDDTCSSARFTSSQPVSDAVVGSAPFLPAHAGLYRWVATYSGDALNRPAADACGDPARTVTVLPASTVLEVHSSRNPSAVGELVTITATVDAQVGVPTGSVEFSVDGAPIGSVDLDGGEAAITTTFDQPGDHEVVATYSGSTDHTPSSGSMTQSVALRPTTTTVDASADSVTYGQPITFTATVLGDGATAPSGTVTFTDTDSGANYGTFPLEGGIAAVTTSDLPAGHRVIDALYSGDQAHAASQGSVSLTVGRAVTATALTSSANPTVVGASVTLTATVTSQTGVPSGTVTFSADSVTLATVPVDGAGRASLTTAGLGVGLHAITAAYSGSPDFAGSAGHLTQVVERVSTTTTLESSANPATVGQPVVLTAVVDSIFGPPSGTVTFLDGDTTLATVALGSDGTAVLSTDQLGGGSHAITARYDGDAEHSGSSAMLTQSVVRATTSLIAEPVLKTLPNLVAHLATTDGQPLAGKPVVFTGRLLGLPITLCTATTNGAGTATCSGGGLVGLLGLGVYTATFAGDAAYEPSTAHGSLT